MAADHYDTLGVPKDADAATIKKAYRRKSAKAHPDRNGGDHRAMVALNRAHDTLSDPEKRARYDQTGQDGPQPKTIDEKARGVIMQIFQAVMDQAADHHDVIESVKHAVSKQMLEVIEQAKGLRTKATTYERRRKRLKYSGKDRDFISDMLGQRIEQMRKQADEIEKNSKEIGERALEMLNDFSYEAAAPDFPGFTVYLKIG